MEVWKNVLGFEDYYLVSNTGKVKSIRNNKLLKLPIDRYGYLKVAFSVNNKRTYSTVHRIVTEAFIPNPENKPCVNHIDSNKKNNHVENLEWCTYKENAKHAWDNNMIFVPKGDSRINSKLSYEKVKEIIELHNSGVSCNKLAKIYKVNQSTIWRAVNKKKWIH